MKRSVVLFFLIVFLFASGAFAEGDVDSKIGDRVDIGAVSVGVLSVSPYKEKNSLIRDHIKDQNNGRAMKFFCAEVLILNSSRDDYEYSPYQFTFIDSEEEEYQWCISTKEPKLEGKILKPGMISNGFLVFAVPEESVPSRIVFDPGYLIDGVVNFYINE